MSLQEYIMECIYRMQSSELLVIHVGKTYIQFLFHVEPYVRRTYLHSNIQGTHWHDDNELISSFNMYYDAAIWNP